MTENTSQTPIEAIKEAVPALASERWWGVACYVPIFNIVTCVITAVKMSNSKFCLFHARQGLVLFALWFLTIVIAVVSPLVSLMFWGAVLLLHAAGVVLALGMKQVQIPLLGQLAMRIPELYLHNLLTGTKADKPVQQPQATVEPTQQPQSEAPAQPVVEQQEQPRPEEAPAQQSVVEPQPTVEPAEQPQSPVQTPVPPDSQASSSQQPSGDDSAQNKA